MALDKGFTEFDVSVLRDRNQPLGIQIFRKKSTLTILRIHKQQVEVMKDRQLMIGDVVLSVNGKSDIQGMLLELKDINADKCNLSVRRYVTADNAPTTVPLQFHGIPEVEDKMTCNVYNNTIKYVAYVQKQNLTLPPSPPQPPPPATPPPTHLARDHTSEPPSHLLDTRPWESSGVIQSSTTAWDPWSLEPPPTVSWAQQETETLGNKAAVTSSPPVISVASTETFHTPQQVADACSVEKNKNRQLMPGDVVPENSDFRKSLTSKRFGEEVQASPTAQHLQPEPQNSHALTINSYDPPTLEKTRGYLTLVKGTVGVPGVDDKMTCKICNSTINEGHFESDRHLQYVAYVQEQNLILPPSLPQPPPPAILPLTHLARDRTSEPPSHLLETRPWESSGVIQPSTTAWDPWSLDLPPTVSWVQQETMTLGNKAAVTSSPPVISVASTETFHTPQQVADACSVEKNKNRQLMPGDVVPENSDFRKSLTSKRFGEEVQASPTAQHLQPEPQNSHALTINSYDPHTLEKTRGYLTLVKGTVVTVQSGTRQPAVQGNAFNCDYVFAWLANHEIKPDTAGWVPVNILGIIPPCQDIVHEKQF